MIQNDKKMLRPGMNIDAEIIVEKRENVIAVPLSAVGRGNIVKVLVENSGEKNDNPQVQEGINTEGFPTKNADTSELHKNNENNPPKEVSVQKQNKNDGINDFLNGMNLPFLNNLKNDGDMGLVLGLLLILISEKSDRLLLLALLYILM